LAEKLKGTPEEDIDSAIEESFSKADLEKALDHPLWNYLRHKYNGLSGSGIEIEERPSVYKDLNSKTKFVIRLIVDYDPPSLDEKELLAEFQKAFKGVV
jgi:hypothetical protein